MELVFYVIGDCSSLNKVAGYLNFTRQKLRMFFFKKKKTLELGFVGLSFPKVLKERLFRFPRYRQ